MLRQESYEKRKASEEPSENEWEEMANKVRSERDAEGRSEITGEDLGELRFTQIGEDDLQTIVELESKLYPQETIQYGGLSFLKAMLNEPKGEEYSFMIEDQVGEEQKPVGYCIAYETRTSLSDPQFYGKGVYVADFGINLIEMEARKDTSYRIFTNSFVQSLLAKRGYAVTDHGLSDDEWADGDKTYLISLRRAEQAKKAA